MTTRLVVGAISAEANRLATDLVHQLVRNGHRPCAAHTGWTPHAPSGHARKTSLLGFTRMLSRAAEQSGRAHLGLEMACAQGGQADGIFSGLFLYAPTVRDALQALTRYFPVGQTGTTVSLMQASGTARFTYDIRDPAVGDRLQDSAYTLGKICRSLRRCAGQSWVLDEVTLSAARPHIQEPYRRFFEAPVVFDAPSTSLCFSSSLLDLRLATADAHRYEDFCSRLERLMPTPNEPDLLEDALRDWLAHAAPQGKATLEQAAADFGVTPRTMQRRLKDQGIRFQSLLANVRMESAQRMLAESRLPVTQIAERLGFSETSAFTRAFRTYTRLSPRAFRQARFTPA